MNKIACRTYAVLCFFYGVFCIACGAVGFYWALNGIPPSIAAELESAITLPIVVRFLPWLSAGFLVCAIIFITVGVFAWLRYVSVMIVGCVLWFLTFGHSMIPRTGASDGSDAFALINGIAFVVLTCVAAIAVRRPRSPQQQLPPFA